MKERMKIRIKYTMQNKREGEKKVKRRKEGRNGRK
jgi:hypothetical protein